MKIPNILSDKAILNLVKRDDTGIESYHVNTYYNVRS